MNSFSSGFEEANSSAEDVWPLFPFEAYDIQKEMMSFTKEGLEAVGNASKPVLAMEVPTGCGKTMALLTSVLQFQNRLHTLNSRELVTYFKERYAKTEKIVENQSQTTARGSSRSKRSTQPIDPWSAHPDFISRFSNPSLGNRRKRTRDHIDDGKSSALRRRFSAPPCTIIYATRTHAQIHQVTRELRRLIDLPNPNRPYSSSSMVRRRPLRMNILGSRTHYCINGLLQQQKKKGALPHEGNNLGEICDKLVSLNQCPCWENYDTLSCSAIDGQGIGFHKGQSVWDIEDLVAEGVSVQKCPYYAARDLIFYADITLCTYPYLLDPIIRHESHFESALKNNCIIIFDEAHNIPVVCEEALSIESSGDIFQQIAASLEPIVSPADGCGATLSYPRDFRIGHSYSLLDIFQFLLQLLRTLEVFFSELASDSLATSQTYVNAVNLVSRIQNISVPSVEKFQELSKSAKKLCSSVLEEGKSVWFELFRLSYGVIFSLGVTFNPFDIPIHILGILKRWLVILRFLLRYPKAFALRGCRRDWEELKKNPLRTSLTGKVNFSDTLCEVRCLDGKIAFFHLLKSTFRIILASGTLTPFPQLARSLGITNDMWKTLEGWHVVPQRQYSVSILSQTRGNKDLRCTFSSLSSDAFLEDLVETILHICSAMKKGGVLVMVPNYKLMDTLSLLMKKTITRSNRSLGSASSLSISNFFVEPRKGEELQELLKSFKAVSSRHVSICLAVYRGKFSEGLDFSDDMARMVMCVGIPFRPVTSWAVLAKRQYSGEEWYVDDAACAVNQALGRCLRHANDYGSIILLDHRFEEPSYQSKLSRWCRDAVSIYLSVNNLRDDLHEKHYEWTQSSREEFSIPVIENNQSKNGKPLRESSCSCSAAVLKSTDSPQGIIQCDRSVREHPLSCAAIKLLYEQHENTKQVTSALLKSGIEKLNDCFFDGEYFF